MTSELRLTRPFVLLLFFLFGAAGQAEDLVVKPETSPESSEEHVDNPQPLFNWLVDTRNNWSRGIGSMASSLDGFLAGKDAELQSNTSYLRLRIGSRWEEGEGVEDDTDFKLRLDLPTAQKRWKIFIENQLDELETLASDNREDLITPGSDDHDLYGGIGRDRITENWQFRPEVGVKLRFPLETFARFRAKRAFELPGLWSGRFQQSLYYFHRDGFGAKGRLMFERPWKERFFWRLQSEVKWQDDTDNIDLAQVLTLQQSLTSDAAVAYEIGVLGDTRPSTKTSDYYFNVRFRQRLYEDWLFLDVIPGVNWPRDMGFESVYSIASRIEILFSE